MPTITAGTVATVYCPLAGTITVTPGTSGRVSFQSRSQTGGQSAAPREIYVAETITVAAGDTLTLEAINVDATYTEPAGRDGSLQALVSGAWSQYSAQTKTDADALASVLYTRTFDPGELIAGDALIVEGLLTVPNSAATKRCKLQIGGVDYMTIDLTTSSTFHWRVKMRMRALASQIGWAVGSSNGAYGTTGAAANVTSTIDFSAPVVVQFTAQWPVAGAGSNSIVLEAIDIQRFRPAA